MPNANRHFLFWGTLFLILQVMVGVRNWTTDYWSFYWFCNFAPALFAVFFFFNKPQWIKALIHIGLLGQTTYILSFISALCFDAPLFGYNISFEGEMFVILTTLIMHLSTVVAYGATLHMNAKPASLAYSAIILTVMYGAVRLLTEPSFAFDWNYNYIYSAGIFGQSALYTELWPFIAFLCVVLPVYGIERAVFYLYHTPRYLRPHHFHRLHIHTPA